MLGRIDCVVAHPKCLSNKPSIKIPIEAMPRPNIFFLIFFIIVSLLECNINAEDKVSCSWGIITYYRQFVSSCITIHGYCHGTAIITQSIGFWIRLNFILEKERRIQMGFVQMHIHGVY